MQFGLRENPGRYDNLDERQRQRQRQRREKHSLIDVFNLLVNCS